MKREQLTNVTTESVDERCAEFSRHAFYCAEQLRLGVAGDNTLYGFRIRIHALANRIIALRTSELAALYHVVTVNDRTGAVTRMTATPVTHDEACVILGKLNPLSGCPHLRRTLELANAAQVAP